MQSVRRRKLVFRHVRKRVYVGGCGGFWSLDASYQVKVREFFSSNRGSLPDSPGFADDDDVVVD